MNNINNNTPLDQRNRFRMNKDVMPTSGMCGGYQHANVVILPKKYAFDFYLFCNRNPKACPIIEVMEPGQYKSFLAKDSDIRTDITRYNVYEDGKLKEEVSDIQNYWQENFVTFLLGCSVTFENALKEEGFELLHEKEGNFLAMYVTNLKCDNAGIFEGNKVVSMRPIKKQELIKSIEVTSKYPHAHGGPIHIGTPEHIGIENIEKPDFGDFTDFDTDEYIPVFWECGVTPQAVAMKSQPSIMITHKPGHMFITDLQA